MNALPTLPALRSDVRPAVICPNAEAGQQVESWAFWYAREIVESVNALLRAAREGAA